MKNWMLLLIFFPFWLAAQSTADTAAVKAPIITLFDAMRAGDSAMLKSAFHPNARLQTVFTDKAGKRQVKEESIDAFAQAVGSPHDAVYDEKIWSYDIQIDGLLATAWTEYSFFLGDQFSHCGVNAFQLFNSDEGWKILHITDTRRRENCHTTQPDDQALIHQLMDAWHHAAAVADEDVFFGSMTEDGIYLGTDASERWLRDELKAWSAKYFERESAWAFTPSNRVIYFSNDGQTAWFEELLATWMGTCRGSGVLSKTDAGWKIRHYNLAIAVPNEKVDGFLELMKR
ncbi:MAG TPA: nuclear transport factor 2 family protein [Saprospiraceae bacterium]|nr:nuclear transport factor 2 family protein [Saprospiraceae bacterium]HMQ84319.1 nuclear transport factor 2 family protein [Saprospiraceae bacterium]